MTAWLDVSTSTASYDDVATTLYAPVVGVSVPNLERVHEQCSCTYPCAFGRHLAAAPAQPGDTIEVRSSVEHSPVFCTANVDDTTFLKGGHTHFADPI